MESGLSAQGRGINKKKKEAKLSATSQGLGACLAPSLNPAEPSYTMTRPFLNPEGI